MSKNISEFSTRLKDLREEAGLSMIELARAIGVSDAAICKWENGQAEPKISYIVRLAEYFDCSVDYLIGGDGMTAKPKRAQKPAVTITMSNGKVVDASKPLAALTVDEEQLITQYSGLSPDMKSLVRETVSALSAVPPADAKKKKS